MGDFCIFLIVGTLCGIAPFAIEKIISIIKIKNILGAEFCKSTVDDSVYCKVISMSKDDDIVHYVFCNENGEYFLSTEDKVFTASMKYFVKDFKKIR